MQIVCVSRGTFAGGRRLAEELAARLGYEQLSREELMDAATAAGIQVGRLEMAVVRRQPLGERLAIERERYRAFVTATLCERVLDHSLVYHGRTGHLVIPGVAQALRIRVISDPEHRTVATMERLGLSREKARRYADQMDEDRRRWVRTLYDVDWEDPQLYDAVINLSHMSVGNAATGLLGLAQLPDFQVTPACVRRMQDLLLAARCRLAIGDDPRTREVDVKVRAESGRVWVTFLPRQRSPAKAIPDVLAAVDGIDEILCTMATTNLLWIQERFDPASEYLPHVKDIAGRWNAAVELVQISGMTGDVEEAGDDEPVEAKPDEAPVVADPGPRAPDGGILDDDEAALDDGVDPGLRGTHEQLIAAGRAGGYRIVPGGVRRLVSGIDRTASYSLVVVGDVFRSKAPAPRKRLTRELMANLAEVLRVPVIGAEDLKREYLFGRAQLVRLLAYGAVAAVLVALVFGNERGILEFMYREGSGRMVATAALLVFAPLFAYSYGSFTRLLLRLLKFE